MLIKSCIDNVSIHLNSPPAVGYSPRGNEVPAQSVQTSNVAASMETDSTDFPDWIPGYDLPYLGLDGFGFTLPWAEFVAKSGRSGCIHLQRNQRLDADGLVGYVEVQVQAPDA